MTDKTYIAMCREAKDIQEWWRKRGAKVGDWTDKGLIIDVFPETIRIVDFDNTFSKTFKIYLLEELTYCPTQEDLQGMAHKNYDLVNMWVEFYCFITGRIPKTNEIVASSQFNYFNTSTQLWLAFVMWELYSKKWDGKSWTDGKN